MENKDDHKPKPALVQKTSTRLAAVQAIYSKDITGHNTDHATLALELSALFEDAEDVYSSEMKEESEFARPDPKMIKRLITAVVEHQEAIDGIIAEHLAPGWSMARLNTIMRAILEVAVAELKFFPDVPVKVVINEYATVTRAFFSVSEIGFVNGILERIAYKLRPEQMAAIKEQKSAKQQKPE